MMNVEILHDWPLLGLLGIALLFWWHRSSLASLPPGRARWSLGLRTVLLTLLVLALTEPQWISQRQEQFVYWLVDNSRSVGSAAREHALRFAEEAAALNEKTRAIAGSGFIAFAGEPRLVSTENKKPEEALAAVAPQTLNDSATNLLKAVQFAEASIPAGYAKTVVLFSDGRETHDAIEPELARLRASGVRLFTVPVPPPDTSEVAIRSISAPSQVAEEEPFKLTVEIASNRDTEATLDLFRNGPKIASRTLSLKKGINRVETTQSVTGEKVFEFSASIRAAEDTIADNNHASTYLLCAGKSKILLLSDRPEASVYLARALRHHGILLDTRPAAGAPTGLGDLQNYDLIILDNIPATDLSPRQMDLYAAYVRDFGGGLLMLGGEKSFGLGGYYRTPVEEILPVQCDFEKEEEQPTLGMILVIDHSGSMSGDKMEMAKKAAKAAVTLLSPRDYVGVVAFDDESFWVSELALLSDKGGLLQKISTIEANGGTNMAPALQMALEQLAASPAKLKHIIALTDGMSVDGPFYDIAKQAAGQGMTLSAVGLGGDADQVLLKSIAEWGNGRFYFTDDAASIPQIFTRETMEASKSAIQEAPFLAIPAMPADFLSGIDFTASPFLLGYVTTKAKPTSEVWLVTEKKDPLLATWRFGLGQVGAFTSDARNRWGVEWLKWEGYGPFWAQLVRKLTRTSALKHFPAQITRRGDSFHFTVEAEEANGRPLSDISGELLLLTPDGKRSTLPLQLTGPGLLSTQWPTQATIPGPHHTQLLLKQNGKVIDHQYLSASPGYPDEFLLQPLDSEKLQTVARETGGRFAPTPADLLNDRDAPYEQELWPWLVGAALLLFLADVAVRRWPASKTGASATRHPPNNAKQPAPTPEMTAV